MVVAHEMKQTVDEKKLEFMLERPAQFVQRDVECSGDARAMGAVFERLLSVLHTDDDISQGGHIRADFVGFPEWK